MTYNTESPRRLTGRPWPGWLRAGGLIVVLSTVCLAAALILAPQAAPGATPSPRIVNGVLTSAYPSVGALLIPFDPGAPEVVKDLIQCTGTMIGCRTFLTAAHCFCPPPKTGADCQGDAAPNPAHYTVFLQHGGFFAIARIAVNPAYELRKASDVAVVVLASPVTGIAPSPINTTATPAFGTPGTIVGFGRSGGDPASNMDYGLKRFGKVVTARCRGTIPNSTHVCWDVTDPLGPPGESSGICNGDSGGPLFVESEGKEVVAGTTSDRANPTCLPPSPNYDDDVFNDRVWIQEQGGDDLANMRCGDMPQVGTAARDIFAKADELDAGTPSRAHSLDVPAGATLLRVALNGDDSSDNNFDLAVRAPSTTEGTDCTSTRNSQYEFCEIANPAAGTWTLTVTRTAGAGRYQLTATTFGAPATPCPGDCSGDEVVTVDEIITMVTIALGTGNAGTCPAGDTDGDGAITIDEIITAVTSALEGCTVRIEEVVGRALSEPTLIRLAYAFEQATHARQVPQFLPRVARKSAGQRPATTGGLQ